MAGAQPCWVRRPGSCTYVRLPAHHALVSLTQQPGRARSSKHRLHAVDVTEITMQNHMLRIAALGRPGRPPGLRGPGSADRVQRIGFALAPPGPAGPRGAPPRPARRTRPGTWPG